MSTQPKPLSRPISGLERIWLSAGRLAPPFAIEWVVEGQGVLSLDRWQAALDAVTDAHPFTAVRLKGLGKRLRFETDGARPKVRSVDSDGWDGQSSAGAPWLEDDPLGPRHGPVAELVLLKGAAPRVIFRVLHAAFDGRGLGHWAREIGRALRGEPLEGPGGPIDDREAAKAMEAPPSSIEPPADAAAPWTPVGTDLSTNWVRRRIQTPGQRVLPRVLLALATAIDGLARISVPVDLRPRLRDAGFADAHRYTGNLTGIVQLNVAPMIDLDRLAAQLRTVTLGPGPASHAAAAHQLRGVPLVIMTKAGEASARTALHKRRWPVSATVSNFGLHQPASLSGAGFEAERIFTVVPGAPGLPLFLSITGDPNGIELCASAPRALADADRLRTLLETLL